MPVRRQQIRITAAKQITTSFKKGVRTGMVDDLIKIAEKVWDLKIFTEWQMQYH
jgi:hypothetical protein